MNTDFKDRLLEYLTGNITEGSKSSTPYYLDINKTDTNTLHNYMYNAVGEYLIKGSVKCTDGKGVYNGKIIFWGEGTTKPCFLLLTDEELNPISIMTTYASGYNIKPIMDLKVAEDGNMYALDCSELEEGQWKFRVVLFNNLSEIPKKYNTYTCILRNSYYLQGYTIDDDLSPNYMSIIQKSKQSATYYFAIPESTGHLYCTGTLKINVGEANEWTRLSDITTGADAIKVYFDKEDKSIATFYDVFLSGNDKTMTKTIQEGNSTPRTITILEELYPYFNNQDYNDDYGTKILITETNKVYLILYGLAEVNDMFKQLTRVYILEDSTPRLLFTRFSDSGNRLNMNQPLNLPLLINDNLFMYLFEQEDTSSTASKDVILFTMVNSKNDINTFVDTDLAISRIGTKIGALSNKYNLYDFNMYLFTNGAYSIINTKIIYNTNYNGEEYISTNVLKPYEGILYSNNKPIFARNLYNSKVFNNKVISVLNVPNNMLNDISISKQNLIGYTNYDLIENTQSITKNIYEDLYINFYNTIKMENRNENIYIEDKSGAIRLTQSAFKTEDYENAKANKVKVTYEDNSYFITDIEATILNGVATYEIIVYVPDEKDIYQIDILSNDEQTIYNTIKNDTIKSLNLESDKYYKITQDVYID